MSKPKAFVDFDNVLVNSTKRLCDILNTRYKKSIQWQDVKAWNLQDCYPTNKEEIEEIFDSTNFFTYLEDYIMPYCVDTLNILSEDYDIICVSIGSYNNISNKAQFLKRYFPMVKQFIGLANSGELKMDKSLVNMRGEGNVFLDDCLSNIQSSNCPNKLLYSERLLCNEWNGQKDGSKLVGCWMEVMDIIQLKRKEKVWR